MHTARVALLPVVAALSGCQISVPPSQLHPSVASAPASSEDSAEARDRTVLQTAADDLGCDRVGIVLTFDRRYANSASIRYVVEGCGQRATYAETCENYPHCRYLLVSAVPIRSAEAGPRGEAQAP